MSKLVKLGELPVRKYETTPSQARNIREGVEDKRRASHWDEDIFQITNTFIGCGSESYSDRQAMVEPIRRSLE